MIKVLRGSVDFVCDATALLYQKTGKHILMWGYDFSDIA